ncbi:hypothetical protein CASFOL_032283 [Castilleja foliolosa]|uniref:C2 NT-type domain-containing protein n=1 Tax=Castilleja foliolosa TaxID=1961234 RepID=A0ABD3C1N5_9LAMI
MVVKIMRWRPWPPLISRKYEVKLVVKRLECGDWAPEGADKDNSALAVEIRWKGPKISLGSFRRTVKRNCTREETVKRVGADDDDGQNGAGLVVEWDEEFQSVCGLSGYKGNVFHPWEINFTVLHGQNQGVKNKISVVGTLNLAEYASKNEEQVTEINIPLTFPNVAVEQRPLLSISLSLLELIAAHDPSEVVQSTIVPLPSPPSASGEQALSPEKDEVSALKASLRKVKIFTEYVSARRAKKVCLEEEDEGSEGRRSAKSDSEYGYPFDSDLLEEFDEGGESDESKEISAVRKSFSYGTLAFANYAGVSFYSGARVNNEDEDWVYYSNRRRSDAGCVNGEEMGPPVVEQPLVLNSKRSILPWKKRKLSFRSPKPKGEPLLKKAYGEEGGDDIDFDRRQLSSDESGSFGILKTDEESNTNCQSVSEFGDDCFAVGTWDQKEITSRDGNMKIQTHVFFASIDQRSERAAGESACTALVAVIADWLQNNCNLMPIKSQFDSLIRDGSLEWRNLCENEIYRDRFPDKHFDLETVIQAKIRDLCVVPGKSFVGFFHPEGMDEGNFDFLHGAMSFDSIWDEITSSGSSGIFILSWNDHFFVLKVESDAYYIIDTLGERLHEGCDQAYVLKFDKDTVIYKLPGGDQPSEEEKPVGEAMGSKEEECEEIMEERVEEEEVIFRGKECCKEYIKSFLAAIPLRELQTDIKKGLKMSAPIHHRLQIEFHFTQPVVREEMTKTPLEVVEDAAMDACN